MWGGREKVKYYVRLGYVKNEGGMEGDEYDGLGCKMKMNGEIRDWVEVGGKVKLEEG